LESPQSASLFYRAARECESTSTHVPAVASHSVRLAVAKDRPVRTHVWIRLECAPCVSRVKSRYVLRRTTSFLPSGQGRTDRPPASKS